MMSVEVEEAIRLSAIDENMAFVTLDVCSKCGERVTVPPDAHPGKPVACRACINDELVEKSENVKSEEEHGEDDD